MHTKLSKILSGAMPVVLAVLTFPSLSSLPVSADSLGFDVNIAESINVTIPGSIASLDLTPSIIGDTFSTTDLTITVSTNYENGYTLYMSSNSTNLTMTEASSDGTYTTIPTLDSNESGYSESDFTTNRWGYRVTSTDADSTANTSGVTTNYFPFSTTNELIQGTSPTNGDATTITFAANIDINKPAGTYENTLTFTAVPRYYDYPTTIEDLTYMQDFAKLSSMDKASVLDSMTEEQTYTLKDSRDDQTYNIALLKDGNVWLLDNLALDLTNSTVLASMDSTNTNASDATLDYLKNGGGTTSDKYAITGVVNWTSSSSYASSYSFSDPLVDMNSKDVIPSDTISTAGGYMVGGYYNYCAASAGSYCYGDGTSTGTSSGNASEDICPAGWRLPTGGSGEYATLANAIYGSTSSTSDATAYANYRAALRLPLSGYFFNGSASYQGSNSRFWSSTRDVNTSMRILYVGTSNIEPQNGNYRVYGYAVRCILQ